MLKKCVKRVLRILCGKKGIYGRLGKGNKFTSGVYVNEMAVIGCNNYFGPYTMVNNAVIGNYCSIAPGVKIGQAKHSIDYITTYNKISRKNIGFSMQGAPAEIGNDVWLGANVVVMQGVKIGNGAVVGANAVVTRDVPDYAIVAGVPAKLLRYRFEPEQIAELNNSCWWDGDFKTACKKVRGLEDILH